METTKNLVPNLDPPEGVDEVPGVGVDTLAFLAIGESVSAPFLFLPTKKTIPF